MQKYFIEGALPSVSKDVLVSQILETKEALEIRFSEYSKLVHTTQNISDKQANALITYLDYMILKTE